MPSYVRQGITVFTVRNKKKKNKKTATMMLVRKTGYHNIWIDGKQYYYNEKQTVDKVNANALYSAFTSYKPKPKGIIVLTRKP